MNILTGIEHQKFLKFIKECLRPFSVLIVVQFAIMSFWAFDLNFRPYLLKVIIDTFTNFKADQPLSVLFTPASLYIGMFLLVVLFHSIYDFVWLHINPPLRKNIIESLTKKMMLHSQELFSNHLAGSLANKIRDVTKSMTDLLRVVINNFYSCLIAVVMAIINLYFVHPHCALMMAIWITVFLAGTIALSKRTRHLSSVSTEIHSQVIGRIVDVFSNILNVRLFCSVPFESRQLKKLLGTYVITDQKRDWYALKLYLFQGLSFVLYQATCIGWLVYQFYNSTATAGDFAMVLTLNAAISDLLWDISDDLSRMNEYLGNIMQGLTIALTPAAIKDTSKAPSLVVREGRITYDMVKFSYSKTEPFFENKSITIEPGQKVGLVGYSGSGKSTFINLILRLFDVQEGQILIDGQNIAKVTQKSLHEAISIIPQDLSLFHRTILENIGYGKPNAKKEEIFEAAKKAHAHDFISALPEGYNTPVGEQGANLSGGQRQRIIIARAILKNAPILILDEATSQMDSITEKEIQQTAWQLMKYKTTLVVAHRLSTLLYMDRILVFEKGVIVEDGTHEQLLALNGLYKTLWDAQSDGFLPECKLDVEES